MKGMDAGSMSARLLVTAMNSQAPYPGDVLEHALNNGVNSASRRYHTPVEYVKGLVEQFVKECEPNRDMRCSCQRARDRGSIMMCFVCTGPKYTSRFRL
jgi:hypothetical protein